MTTKIVTVLALVSGLATLGCDSIGQAMTAHTDVVARAAGHELKVDRTAALINSNPQIPPQPDVVVAVANLWVDYMLLATAASQDTTLRNVSLDALVQPMVDQNIVDQLQTQVVKADTALTDEALRRLFDQSGQGAEVRARHILISLPSDATPAQRDSVSNLARQLRQRAQGGADFAALARQYSGDQGSAQQGGDLGFFPHERMLKPFSDAAFALQPGQISEIVETPYGMHIIKLEERRNANFEEQKEAFRARIKDQRVGEAQQKYFKELTDPLKIEVAEGAYQVAKDLAARPEVEVRGRAASRPLVRYQGGSFTAGEYLEFMRRIQPPMRSQIPQMPDEQLKNVLETITRNRILVEEARRKKLTMPKTTLDSIQNGIYGQLVDITRSAGLLNIPPQEGENKSQAIERRVNALLESTIKGEQNLIPLGPLAYGLRDQFGGEIFESAVPAVVTQLQATRPPQPQQPRLPTLPPDTTTTRQ
ncbi:MAG: peptidylprolyl isomerase [Longimicrobiales bacterium]